MNNDINPPTTPRLPHLGDHVARLKNQIIDAWTGKLRAHVGAARHLDHPILVDTAPLLLDHLAKVFSPTQPGVHVDDLAPLAQEHGGMRARLSVYKLEEVVHESQLLRDAILETLGAEVLLTREHRLLIGQTIDFALRQSLTAFALVQADIREQFANGLTHGLRDLIGVIKTTAAVALEGKENPAETRTLLGRVIATADRSDRLIQDLLDASLARANGRLTLEISRMNLLDLIRAVATDVAKVSGDRFAIEGEPAAGWWCPTSLRRALETLYTNALAHGHPGAPVRIRLREECGRVLVSVQVDGPEIPVGEQEQIFQVFARAEAARRAKRERSWGVGLGLVRAVAESHGGSFIVTSRAVDGNTFTISLPPDARPYQRAPVT